MGWQKSRARMQQERALWSHPYLYMWSVADDMTGWKLKVFNNTMLAWSLMFGAAFAISVLKPGAIRVDPLVPCAVVAVLPAWVALMWSNIRYSPWFRV